MMMGSIASHMSAAACCNAAGVEVLASRVAVPCEANVKL